MAQVIGHAVAEMHRKQLSAGLVIAEINEFALSGYQCIGMIERVKGNVLEPKTGANTVRREQDSHQR
jgi:hypothetical protein